MAFVKTNFVDNQTVITAEFLNRLQDAIIELEKGGRFTAIYGQTTNAEMWAAHQAGKMVMCYDAGTGNLFPVFNITEARAWFSGYAANTGCLVNWLCDNNAWSAGSANLV